MGRLKKFWVCPICRKESLPESSNCDRCTYRPLNVHSLTTSSVFSHAIARRIGLIRSMRDLQLRGKDTSSKSIVAKRKTAQSPRYSTIKSHRFEEEPQNKVQDEDKIQPNGKVSQAQPATPPYNQLAKPEVELPQPNNKPNPAQILTPEKFEWYCAEWCAYFGHKNVSVTQFIKDGGIDIYGEGFIAQVKFQELPVGVKPIRELAGVLTNSSAKIAYFFTLNGYTNAAIAEAEELHIAIFEVKPFDSTITAKTSLAALVLEDAGLTT